MADSGSPASDNEQPESAAGLGARIRKARESQQLSIGELESELRIRADALVAIEAGQFESLGAPVFAKGYLKQYGARLGLDVQALAAGFDAVAGGVGVNIAPTRSLARHRDHPKGPWIAVGMLVLIVVALGLYWWFGQPEPWSFFNSFFD